MDVNHEVYNTDLRRVAFVLSFMTARAAATWKAQFIDKANTWPTSANPNNKLGTYATFRKELINAFSMFDLVGNALNELWALRMKKNNSIDEQIAKFKMLAVELKIDTMNPLTIKFKEMLPWGLMVQLIKLGTPLKTINNWYKWAVTLDHRHHKLNQVTKQTRGNMAKEKNSARRYYFPQRERDPNAMDVDRLSINNVRFW
jgi:Retrotransposon gag protein